MSRRPASASPPADHALRVLLGVGGGIAAYKAAELVRRLRGEGCEVRCALSRSAEAFLSPLTLEVLSEHAVYRQEYLTPTGRGEESHIVAAQWADVVCLAPTTAHLLARLALGLADDFLTTTLLAFDGPVVMAPAMHDAMWRKEAVQKNVEMLGRRGVRWVGPEEGPLASGDWGMGRMAAPEAIVAAVVKGAGARLEGAGRSLAGRRVVVSAGPTHEALDPVRFLGNRSSGKMGFALAAEAARRGAETTLVAGPVSLSTPAGVERINVMSALEMRDALFACAPQADLVIMTAAVADFRPRRQLASKTKKGQGVPEVDLVANPDILSDLAAVAPEALRVGFAAETEVSETAVWAKLERKNAHLLIWNDVSKKEIGFEADDNEVTVYRPQEAPVLYSRRPKTALASDLLNLFTEILEHRGAEVASTVG